MNAMEAMQSRRRRTDEGALKAEGGCGQVAAQSEIGCYLPFDFIEKCLEEMFEKMYRRACFGKDFWGTFWRGILGKTGGRNSGEDTNYPCGKDSHDTVPHAQVFVYPDHRSTPLRTLRSPTGWRPRRSTSWITTRAPSAKSSPASRPLTQVEGRGH